MHKKLYVLPFDHRGSFFKMFGLSEEGLTATDIDMLRDYKHVVYEGLLRALELGVPKEAAAMLVDEYFGAAIHREAQALGITCILTTEKSGQDEFAFEYGDAFGDHIRELKPHYAKALVRYNPSGDAAANHRQAGRLKQLNDFCKENGFGFLIEPLAPGTEAQLAEYGADGYETHKRYEVMIGTVKELHERGVEPDVWKIEGLSDLNQMTAVVEEVLKDGRDAGVVVLGRGESEEKVKEWLTVAAGIEGVIGFAVGRTVFKAELVAYHQKQKSRQEAVDGIARNYKGFVDLFEGARR